MSCINQLLSLLIYVVRTPCEFPVQLLRAEKLGANLIDGLLLYSGQRLTSIEGFPPEVINQVPLNGLNPLHVFL